MKNQVILLFGVLICLLAVQCSATKKSTSNSTTPKSALTPAPSAVAGDWSFMISNTPLGEVEGVMSLTTNTGDKSWVGKMSTSQGTLPFQSVQVIEKTLTAVFDYDGVPVTLTLQFEPDAFSGKAMVSGYGDFPMKGQRKK